MNINDTDSPTRGGDSLLGLMSDSDLRAAQLPETERAPLPGAL